MNQQIDSRRWYQKKRVLLPGALGGLLLFSGLAGSSTPVSMPAAVDAAHTSAAVQATISTPTSVPYAAKSSASSTPKHTTGTTQLSNDKRYTNVDGQRVQAPTHADA